MGSRMRHLTADRPKPLVAVAGTTLLDRVLDRLATAGITRAVVNVHYLASQIEDALSHRTEPAITISDERSALLDTGGGVLKALPELGPQPFIVHNADTIWQEAEGGHALTSLIAAWRDADMDTLLLLARRDDALGYDGAGDFHCDADGRIRRRQSSETAAYTFAGVSIAHPRLFADAPAGAFSLNVLWDRAIANGRAFGTPLAGRWMHVGTPEAVADADRALSAPTDRSQLTDGSR